MSSPLDIILDTPWTRQGEWGGTTLSRSLTYAGMQRSLADWTGLPIGYEAFLHSGETTYIATGQFDRFAADALQRLRGEKAPLRAFTTRFDRLLTEVTAFLATLDEQRMHDEKIARYFQLHQQMQPYSYVFGYGEDQIVGELLRQLLREAELAPEAIRSAQEAAVAPPSDRGATARLRRLREAGVDARALDYADLVRRHAQVRMDRRILWNRVEAAMKQHFARRAERASLPLRLLTEATPHEIVRGLPHRSTLEARVGGTFLAYHGDVHILTGDEHARVKARLVGPPMTKRTQLDGQSAYPGLVRGRVRIVLTPEQGEALQPGEVLVSDMTTPDLTTACSRAIAIVTDRGGILCHAALVAREMQIPCVLGTEDATRMLHNGDLVEVDAHRGRVRLIEEAST